MQQRLGGQPTFARSAVICRPVAAVCLRDAGIAFGRGAPSASDWDEIQAVDLTFDASYVVYIATANKLSTIDASLLSRFELFYVDTPRPREAVSIARAIAKRVLIELKLTRRFDAATGEVIQQLALLGSPRQMHKVLKAAIGRAIIGGRRRIVVADLFNDPKLRGPDGESDSVAH